MPKTKISTSMNQKSTEIFVGVLVAAAIVCLSFAAINMGQATLSDSGYILYADFASASGLDAGDPVKIAGVEIGEVASIALADYQARVAFRIREHVRIYEDAVASIKTDGLIGDKSVSIDPGTSSDPLNSGEPITETRSSRSLHDLLGKWVGGDLVSGG